MRFKVAFKMRFTLTEENKKFKFHSLATNFKFQFDVITSQTSYE